MNCLKRIFCSNTLNIDFIKLELAKEEYSESIVLGQIVSQFTKHDSHRDTLFRDCVDIYSSSFTH